jgi:prepilin-type N-terminal cleavage/methylation domain-containing protein
MRLTQNGFTLIECVLSLAIFGILSFIAVPILSTASDNLSLDAATKKIENDVRYAQSLATTTGDTHGFEAIDSDTYRVYKKTGVGVKTTVTSPQTHQALLIDLADSYPHVTFNAASFPTFVVEFDSTGKPSSGGGTDIALSNSENTSSVRVSSGTGNVTAN